MRQPRIGQLILQVHSQELHLVRGSFVLGFIAMLLCVCVCLSVNGIFQKCIQTFNFIFGVDLPSDKKIK